MGIGDTLPPYGPGVTTFHQPGFAAQPPIYEAYVMKHLLNVFSLLLVGSLAVVTGCSSTGDSPKDGGGASTGAGGASGIPLTPDSTGWVDRTVTGTAMIQGAWYAYGDGIGPDGTAAMGDCVKLGMHQPAECSSIMTPSFGAFPNTAGKLCTKGVAAKVISLVGGTMPDYNNIWGAGIGLDLNNSGGDAGVKMPYNATMNGVTAVIFALSGVVVWKYAAVMAVAAIAGAGAIATVGCTFRGDTTLGAGTSLKSPADAS